jgi:hypothetical protein
MSTTTVSRAATAGLVGGALWALLPVAFGVASLDDIAFGTLSWFAVSASYWIFGVLPPLLILAGLVALRRDLGDDAGRAGRIGIAVAACGMAAMAFGNGVELASITAGGGEVDWGHLFFLIGFLLTVVGFIVTGIVVLRRRRDALSRAAGVLLTLALPIGIGIGVLGSSLDPQNDAWFWATISVPTGIGWVLLGASLRTANRSADAELVTAS